MSGSRRALVAALAAFVLASAPAWRGARASDDAPTADGGREARVRALDYLAEGNRMWAVRTLLARFEAAPGDLESASWALWLLLADGHLDWAGPLLDATDAAPGDPLGGRIALLRIAHAQLAGDAEAAGAGLDMLLRSRAALWPEDRALLADLRQRVRGDRGRPLSVRIEGSGGYSSNAVQSAPSDPGAAAADGAGTGSPLLAVDAVLRLEPWTSPSVRPFAELRGKAVGPLAAATRDYAYADVGGRAGLELGGAGVRLRIAYAGELMALHGGDAYREPGPRLFMEAHRGELELTPLPALQLFAGAGRRIYRELPRSRTEVDGGAALVGALPRGWNLTGIVAGRGHRARSAAWSGGGLTGLVRIVAPLPRGGMVKLKGMVVWDRYPESASYYGADRPRDDVLGKVEIGPWSPPLGGFRVGGSYTLSGRRSTVTAYSYTDHRVLVRLRWEAGGDPRVRRAAPADDHQALPYGLGENGDGGLDRVQDLLRQEDSARRGSSCVD